MPTGVELQIQRQADNIAAWRAALVAAVTGRTLLWSLADAAQDIPYENRVKGADIYAVDGVMNNLTFGNQLNKWFSLHADYFRLDAPTLGNFTTALGTWKWRAHEYWAKLYEEAIGSKINPALVFPRHDLNLGSYARTTGVFTDGDAVNTSYASAGKVGARAAGTVGVADWDVTATLKRVDGTTVALTVQFASGSVLGTTETFGQTDLSADAAAGQAVLQVADTAPFKVGEPVLVEDDDDQEYGVVSAVNAGVSITLSANLRNAYETADNAKVTPLFTDATNATHAGGTNGDTCALVIVPDRAVSL